MFILYFLNFDFIKKYKYNKFIPEGVPDMLE